jgi:uncharacterized protein (UPF0333 family)
MLRRHLRKQESAQVFLEYAIVVAAVITIMVTMGTFIKRGSQGMIKTVADQIGVQADAEQKFDDRGHLERSYTASRSYADKLKNENAGQTTYTYTETTDSSTNAVVNLGYTPN